MTSDPPYSIGERIRPTDLKGWVYAGLSGRPDKDADAVRRYRKGDWVLEIHAHIDQTRQARVKSIRTLEQDQAWWHLERSRRGAATAARSQATQVKRKPS